MPQLQGWGDSQPPFVPGDTVKIVGRIHNTNSSGGTETLVTGPEGIELYVTRAAHDWEAGWRFWGTPLAQSSRDWVREASRTEFGPDWYRANRPGDTVALDHAIAALEKWVPERIYFSQYDKVQMISKAQRHIGGIDHMSALAAIGFAPAGRSAGEHVLVLEDEDARSTITISDALGGRPGRATRVFHLTLQPVGPTGLPCVFEAGDIRDVLGFVAAACNSLAASVLGRQIPEVFGFEVDDTFWVNPFEHVGGMERGVVRQDAEGGQYFSYYHPAEVHAESYLAWRDRVSSLLLDGQTPSSPAPTPD